MSMEFLTTYGWAFIILLIAIGALTYFGVVRPEIFLPDKCNFEAGMSCMDYTADSTNDEVKAVLSNNFGKTIKIIGVEVECRGTPQAALCTCGSGVDDLCNINFEVDPPNDDKQLWRISEPREFKVTIDDLEEGERPKVKIIITYEFANEYFEKTIGGEIVAKAVGS